MGSRRNVSKRTADDSKSRLNFEYGVHLGSIVTVNLIQNYMQELNLDREWAATDLFRHLEELASSNERALQLLQKSEESYTQSD